MGIGHYTYWPQFPGLLDEMHHKPGVPARKVEAFGVEVTNFGMLDSALGIECAIVSQGKAGNTL